VLLGNIAFGGKLSLLPAGSTGHIGIQHLPGQLVIMAIGLSMSAKDAVHSLIYLGNILTRAVIQSILLYRFFRTSAASKGTLQGRIVF
jgi:hypothetical protein